MFSTQAKRTLTPSLATTLNPHPNPNPTMSSTQTRSSLAFALTSAAAGAVGTPIGGFFSDRIASRAQRRAEEAEAREREAAERESAERQDPERSTPSAASGAPAAAPAVRSQRLEVLTEARAQAGAILLMLTLGSASLLIAVTSMYAGPRARDSFLTFFFAGLVLVFGTSSGLSRTIMIIVPSAIRPFALGFNTLLLHAMGDVPSPPLVGLLIGAWAPNCHTTFDGPNSTAVLDPLCTAPAPYDNATHSRPPYNDDQLGLIDTMVAASLYMSTAIAWWGCAYALLAFKVIKEKRRLAETAVGIGAWSMMWSSLRDGTEREAARANSRATAPRRSSGGSSINS